MLQQIFLGIFVVYTFFCFSASDQIIPDTSSLKILTPSLSSRATLKLRLKNGLEAYLVSDPQAEESSAALAVHIGSWSDPKDYPGMAHFLEHMLFMGTQAYPNENDFSQFISDHGGMTNAYTALDRTLYMFSVNNNSFSGALERFSHFFVDPLFKTSEVGRELHAVDQEHAKNIQSDARRQWMVFKETGNPNHPNKAFAAGNAETLGHIPQQALISWFKTYYKAPLMRLVLYSPLPIDTLKNLVVQDFSAVATGDVAQPSYDLLSSAEQRGHLIYLRPIKDVKLLSLEWELPHPFALDSDTKSAELVAYVLQNGGRHSLIETLKKEHLADAIDVSATRLSQDHLFLDITLSLTKEGVVNRDLVIKRCFQTINLLKTQGIPLYLFQEMQTMATLNYEYQSRIAAFDFVSSTASDLLYEPLASYPQKTYLASGYSPKNLQQLLAFLTPQNCIFTLVAPEALAAITANKKEKWNGGEYALQSLPSTTLTAWLTTKPSPDITLPTANPYIPQNLSLVSTKVPSLENPIPLLLAQNSSTTSYFWEDVRYRVPEVAYYLGIKTPSIEGSARSHVLTDLLIKTFYQKESPLLSTASDAGLTASLSLKNFALLLTVEGFSEKAPEFFKHLLLKLKNVSCTQEEFNLYKEQLLAAYNNQEKAQPYVQAGEIMSHILYNDAPLALQKALLLKDLPYADFIDFTQNYLSKTHLYSLYTGNLLQDEAKKLNTAALKIFASTPYPLAEQEEKVVLVLPKSQGPYMVVDKIDSLGNAALLAIQEGCFSFESKAAQTLLTTVLSESFFNTLRSKQQTGYIATSWSKDVDNELLQFFLVQSGTHQPEDLIGRFELFLENYVKDFSHELPQERFEEVKENCMASLKQLPPNLSEMASYLYELAFIRKGAFTFNEQLIAAIEKLSYTQLKAEAHNFFSRKNTQRLAVLVEGSLPAKPFVYQKISPEALKQSEPAAR
ncbi:MAG: hypothetical protein FJZ63_03600 [Chlamydiae bacterium]|nr:hypothetical protein [Chlamydiota bacterium]